MPTASPVMTQPIPRLRFSNGVWRVITLRSLEKNTPAPSPVRTRSATNPTSAVTTPLSSVAIPAHRIPSTITVRWPTLSPTDPPGNCMSM